MSDGKPNRGRVLVAAEFAARLLTGMQFGHEPHYFEVVADAIPEDFEIVGVGVADGMPDTVEIIFATAGRGGDYDPVMLTVYREGVS